jgi:hypothetical protein
LPGQTPGTEGSWRHDQYSDVAGTSNPKVAFNWTVSEDVGLTIRGAWGTSFRAPSFGETSPLANNNIQGWNMPAIFAQSANITVNCDAELGSAAYRLSHPAVGPALGLRREASIPPVCPSMAALDRRRLRAGAIS